MTCWNYFGFVGFSLSQWKGRHLQLFKNNMLFTFLFASERGISMFPVVGVSFSESGGWRIKCSCPGKSRSYFVALGEESPIWNSEGVGGSAFLERRSHSVGRTDSSMSSAPQSQMRRICCVLFQKASIFSAGWVFLKRFEVEESTHSAAKIAVSFIRGLLELGSCLSYAPCRVVNSLHCNIPVLKYKMYLLCGDGA